MAPGPASRHVHRAPRIVTDKEWEDSPSPEHVGEYPCSGRKGTARWRTGDGTNKTIRRNAQIYLNP